MTTNIPEKIVSILDDLNDSGFQNVTRLTILKKWFNESARLGSFASFVARKAISHKGKVKNKYEIELFKKARRLFIKVDVFHPKIDKKAADHLYNELKDYQNNHRKIRWGQVRIIENWNLLLIERAIEIIRYYPDHTDLGYKLAADYFNSYDSNHGTGLYPKSAYKLKEFIQFMFTKEAKKDDEGLNTKTRRKGMRPVKDKAG